MNVIENSFGKVIAEKPVLPYDLQQSQLLSK